MCFAWELECGYKELAIHLRTLIVAKQKKKQIAK